MKIEDALKGIKLSSNFTAYEFCNSEDGCAIMVPDITLFDKLQKLRETVGPIKITSGFRTPAYNAKCKGSTNSNHLKGIAVDIQFDVSGRTLDQLKDLFASCGFSNIGIYRKGNAYQWFHLDIGPKWKPGNGWTNYKSSSVKVYNL